MEGWRHSPFTGPGSKRVLSYGFGTLVGLVVSSSLQIRLTPLFTYFMYIYIYISFFENVRRIGRSDYIPNEQDVLRARSKTTGITETRFRMGQMNIQ